MGLPFRILIPLYLFVLKFEQLMVTQWYTVYTQRYTV